MPFSMDILETSIKDADSLVFRLQQNTTNNIKVRFKSIQNQTFELESGDTCTLKCFETSEGTSAYITSEGTVDAADNSVTFTIPPEDLNIPGIYISRLLIGDVSSVTNRISCFVEIEKALGENNNYNPLTISEIRKDIVDRADTDNPLLGETEFSDSMICNSIFSTIDKWNRTPPTQQRYTNFTFPYRDMLKQGVYYFLFKAKSLNLQRNRLGTNVGGVQYDDKARADLYIKLAQDYKNEFELLMLREKRTNNLNAWVGYV